ncbi:MAG: molybdate ABC transporter permease subunit [Duodenibacillus sp.]
MIGLLGEPGILFSLALTARTCFAALVAFLLLGPAIGFLLARRSGPLIRICGFFVTLPLVFPPVALGYMLLTVLGRSGWIGGVLAESGITLIFSEPAVVLSGVVAGLPLVVRPLQAAFSSSQLLDLEDAARVHGATPGRIFLGITLPLIRPSLAVGLLMGCARVSGEVGITMMLGGNIAGRTNTLSLEIFNAVSRAEFDVANALCVVLSLFAALLFLGMEIILKKSVKI